jgi:hypothetical protein
MSEGFKFGGGIDPVSAEARQADPERDRLARELEPEVNFAIHFKYDEPFNPDEREWEQRLHYVDVPAEFAPPQRGQRADPDRVIAGYIYWLGGAWFWRPHWGGVDDPMIAHGTDQEPSVELDPEVASEADAMQHARRRVAWELAG